MSWSSPPSLVFKVNFDGAARGNLGDARYGGVCRNYNGEIIQVFFGSLGIDTNNSAELEGMIQGIQIIILNGWLSAIVEGDSRILIQMAQQMANGKSTEKATSSWCLAGRLDDLRAMVVTYPTLSFHHIRREANWVVDLMANISVTDVRANRRAR